jgi:DNA-binding beta-propeller fold protein YncE
MFFVVCENVGNRLTAYDTRTGRLLWKVDGEFTAATVSEDGKVYAILSSGTIYGARTVVIDHAGRMMKSSDTAGFDMALDARRQVLWEVGKTIKKCDLELNVLREIHPIKWCAVSVDINPDGSIWVAERDHPDVTQSSNRLHKISSDGQVLKTIGLTLDPACLRIDPSDGSIWVTGYGYSKPVTGRILDAIERRTGPLPLGKKLPDYLRRTRYWPMTCKFDQDGKPLVKLSKGGHSIEIQSSDGSVWLAGKDRIHHYSREGRKLARFGGVSSDQKYIVIIPESQAGTGSSPN